MPTAVGDATGSGPGPVPTGPYRRIIVFARGVRNDRWAMLLIPAVVVYVVVWSYITTLKFYALHATVFDLGLEMEQLWKFMHPAGLTATSYLLAAIDQPFQFLLSPISLPLDYPLLLIVQSLGLASGAFAVYGISRAVLRKPTASFCLALMYLLYFPLGGVNWFDFHAQAFFIPLFLWGFFCYVTRRYRLALVLLLLAGGTTYSYVVLVVLFAGVSALEVALRSKLFKEPYDKGAWKFVLVLLLASVVFFLYQFTFYAYVAQIGFSQNAQIVAGTIPITNRLEVLFFLLVPVLFLPAFAPKWLVMLLPFAYLELRSAADPFNFPAIFQIQYTALAIPFLILGAIFGIQTVDRLVTQWAARRSPNRQGRPQLFRLPRRPSRSTRLAITALVVAIGFATVFQPYGPFNTCCGDNFRIASATDANWTYFNEYSHLVSLVPTATPYVLFQNSMPSVLPRPLQFNGAPLITALEHWVNDSTYDAATNQFPLLLVQGHVVNTPLDYAIADPNNEWYTIGDNVSMYSFFLTLYESGYYGLLGEASGMTALARGYMGPLEYYVPFATTIHSTALTTGGTDVASSSAHLSASNLTGQNVWSSQDVSLAPGTYRIVYSVMTTSTNPQNHLSLLVFGNESHTVLANQTLSGDQFSAPNLWTTVNLTVQLPTAYADVHIDGWYAHWEGTISIRSISVTEISPPSVIFQKGNDSAPLVPPGQPQ